MDDVIDMLGLRRCANTQIGDQMKRGISGGGWQGLVATGFFVMNANTPLNEECAQESDVA